ncbi:PAS domain-containing sensor histidine kinase [Reichenbachiella versicolor]|uniref:PAS domain-containing sensor histidine kinase n=1 Tax=Reichenbachiella versicolor TaxID=1821036 RepID=UPI000D6E00B6|nr:PAS domain-containing sensor histidine kinase [Reichenbachiella versicolor]
MAATSSLKALIDQINHSKDRLWSFDRNLICTVTNNLMANDYKTAFGIKLEPGVSVLQNVPEPIYSVWYERYTSVINGELQTFQEYFQIEGVPSYVEVTIVPIEEDGEVIGGVCTSRDVTKRVQAQMSWHKSEAQLVAQFENTKDSIWSVDADYCLLTMNSILYQNFKIAFGVDLTVGDCIIDLIPEPLRTLWKSRYDRALKGENFQEIDHFEIENIPQYVEVLFNPIKVEDQIIGVACFTKDITAIKISELEAKEASDTKDRLFSIIGHDLKGPVGNIREMAKLLESNGGSFDQDTSLNMIRHIRESSEKVFTLLENLLNWSLTLQGKFKLDKKELDAEALIAESIAPYKEVAKSKKIDTQIDVVKGLMVNGDLRALSSILSNLFSNAIKFTLPGGEVEMSIKKDSEGIVFAVKDNGQGMSNERLESIINNEARSTEGTGNERGTGLGLSLCKEFVRLHDGQFWAESKEGEGSTFYFKIPCNI